MSNTRARPSGNPGEEQATSSTGMDQAGWMTGTIMSDDCDTMIDSCLSGNLKETPTES